MAGGYSSRSAAAVATHQSGRVIENAFGFDSIAIVASIVCIRVATERRRWRRLGGSGWHWAA